MVRPKVVLIAETVLRDAATNTISVIKINEQFYPAGYPLLIPRFAVFSIFERSREDGSTPRTQLVIKLDDEVLFERPLEVDFRDQLLTRAMLQFEGFVIPRAGTLRVTISVGDQSIESYGISAFPAGTPTPTFTQVRV